LNLLPKHVKWESVAIIPGIKPLAVQKTFTNFTTNFPYWFTRRFIDAVDGKTNADVNK
jgi:hypothetical protein